MRECAAVIDDGMGKKGGALRQGDAARTGIRSGGPMAFRIRIKCINQPPQKPGGKVEQARERRECPSARMPDGLVSRVRRRNPRPKNVIASEAGLLARGSSHRFRPSQRADRIAGRRQWHEMEPLLAAYSCGGSAGFRPCGRHRLPFLAPPRMALLGLGTGNLDHRNRAQPMGVVKQHIKNSLYVFAFGPRFISEWHADTTGIWRGVGDRLWRPR